MHPFIIKWHEPTRVEIERVVSNSTLSIQPTKIKRWVVYIYISRHTRLLHHNERVDINATAYLELIHHCTPNSFHFLYIFCAHSLLYSCVYIPSHMKVEVLSQPPYKPWLLSNCHDRWAPLLSTCGQLSTQCNHVYFEPLPSSSSSPHLSVSLSIYI